MEFFMIPMTLVIKNPTMFILRMYRIYCMWQTSTSLDALNYCVLIIIIYCIISSFCGVSSLNKYIMIKSSITIKSCFIKILYIVKPNNINKYKFTELKQYNMQINYLSNHTNIKVDKAISIDFLDLRRKVVNQINYY